MRLLLATALFAAAIYGDSLPDITLPIGLTGTILIRPQFIDYTNGFPSPRLTLQIKNQTTLAWSRLALQFEIGAVCGSEIHQWSIPALMSLGWAKDHAVTKYYEDRIISLMAEVEGCRVEFGAVRLVSARAVTLDGQDVTIDIDDPPVDFRPQLNKIRDEREARAAAEAEGKRKAAEEKVKRDAIERDRQKQLEADRQKKDAEDEALAVKRQAQAEVRAAEERRRLKLACSELYKNTADKKISDLTVKEDQQVRACQTLGLYQPR